MREDGYRGGLVGLPLLSFAVLASALGDCAPDAACNHRILWWLLTPGIMIAALVGLGSRAIINWMIRRRNDRR
jgi:hypothetical protein